MDSKKITVEKIGAEEIPKEGGKKTKSFPKSILKKTSKLKLKGVRDPSSSRRHTIRVLTSKGLRKRDKTLKKKISTLSDQKVTDITKNAGLIKNPEMPQHLKRQILGSAISAGFVSI
jgi:hypothetical protein